ncbi:MAG: fluoride efflux transporter CrcB [Candidatus Zixiibacteriota bacterium]|nr:MAG: fluoride efflux transporter CrcB [candidate division Zixibacteria bacterium]
MFKLAIIGLGGFLGAISRYAVSGLVQRWSDSAFPYGTLAVNIIGCFLLGMVMYLVQVRGPFGPTMRAFLTIGLFGAFTTYSTFGYETYELIISREFLPALMSVGLHLVLGLAAVWLGTMVVKALGI